MDHATELRVKEVKFYPTNSRCQSVTTVDFNYCIESKSRLFGNVYSQLTSKFRVIMHLVYDNGVYLISGSMWTFASLDGMPLESTIHKQEVTPCKWAYIIASLIAEQFMPQLKYCEHCDRYMQSRYPKHKGWFLPA